MPLLPARYEQPKQVLWSEWLQLNEQAETGLPVLYSSHRLDSMICLGEEPEILFNGSCVFGLS